MQHFQKKYSVIIPHYNDSNRLERLIKSIPLSRGDIEIIVIDDCSPCTEELKKIKENYKIKLHFTPKSQSGAGFARNIGLQNATGFYLIFADSDDFFSNDAFKIIDSTLNPSDDLTYYLADGLIENSNKRSIRAEYLNKLCIDFQNQKINDVHLKIHHVVPWAKVYKKKYIEKINIQFDHSFVSNDVKFNVVAALKTNRINVVDKIIYIVTRSPNSLTSRTTKERFINRLEIAIEVSKVIKDLGFIEKKSGLGFVFRSIKYGLPTLIKTIRLLKRSNLSLNFFTKNKKEKVINFLRKIFFR